MTRSLLVLCLASALAGLACGDDDSGAADASPGTDAPGTDAPGTDAPMGVDVGEGTDAGDPGPVCATAGLPALDLEPVGEGFEQPVFVTSAPDDPDVLYVIEKPGRIIVVQGGARRGEPFLEVPNLFTDGEQGLLGLAFHPDYETNGRFFTFEVPRGPRRNTVREYRRSAGDRFRADAEPVATLIDEPDSESNHNGGMLAFGPDGFLYVGFGDEGGADDRHGPVGNGLNPDTLFGSILRLDVDAAPQYAAAGNPFVDGGGRPQIWAIGLRNPWRFSFDRVTGDLWIGDVGQNRFEEITQMTAPIAPGANLGWRAYEGNSVFDADLVDRVPDHTAPIIDFDHDDGAAPVGNGCSVTGGFVYRGSAIPGLRGWYLYGDFCSPHIGAIRACDGELQEHVRVDDLSFRGSNLASFGQDGHGEIYLAYLNGQVMRVIP